MLPTFVIFLREGIEASMIIAILLSYLAKIDQRQRFRDVYWGVVAALGLTAVGGVLAYLLIEQYDGSNVQTYFETTTYVLATAILTGMTLWMHAHAPTMAGELRSRSDVALSRSERFGLGLLAFQAVGREGLETMVFTLAIIFASARQAGTPVHGSGLLVGALAGLAVALALAVAIYRLGTRLNFKIFFRVLGVLLMFFAAGLLVDAIQNLQELGWLPFGTHVLWNTSGALAESSNLGDLAHSFLGYADHPTILQGVVWVIYVVASVVAFSLLGRPRRPKVSA